MVAICPQVPAETAELIRKSKLDFEILFDEDNQYGRELDIVHGFTDELKPIYGTFGIDVGSANRNQKWELPLPARIVIGAGHEIKSIEYNVDYTQRPEPAATLEIVAG